MKTRIARPEDMDVVYRLTHDQYVKEGYCDPQPDGKLIHYPHLDNIPETVVFVVEDEDGEIIGTNSITFDGPNKLHVDEDFPKEVEKVRRNGRKVGRKLAASWRIVTSPKTRNSMKVIMELIRVTIEEGCKQHAHEMLFSFNPKHEKIYAKLLGLKTIARGDCDAVNKAPGVLMHTDSRSMIVRWRQVCQKRGIPYNCDIRDVWWPTSLGPPPLPWWMRTWEKIDMAVAWVVSLPLWPIYWAVKFYFDLEERMLRDDHSEKDQAEANKVIDGRV